MQQCNTFHAHFNKYVAIMSSFVCRHDNLDMEGGSHSGVHQDCGHVGHDIL